MEFAFQTNGSWSDLLAAAQWAVTTGAVALALPDHYFASSGQPMRDSLTQMGALAVVTDEIELVSLANPVTFRHPAVLAKILGDQRIAAGDLVMQLHGAANRDPEHFDDPERLDITRHPNRHVAFGFGPHFCIGASLARLEAPIALSALLTRIPEMNLDAEVETLQWENTVFRSLNKLPVAW